MFWQAQEVFRHGGLNRTHPGEITYGHYRAKYRRFYLWWIIDEDRGKSRLHVAHVCDFDRWANSRVYEGPIPETMADLDRLLTRLEGGRLRGRATFAVFYDVRGWFETRDANYCIVHRSRCYSRIRGGHCPVPLVPGEGTNSPAGTG